MPKKRKRRGSFEEHYFFCRRCYFVDKGSNAKQYKGRIYRVDDDPNNDQFVCKGLTTHLSSPRHSDSCGMYYTEKNLHNFRLSLVKYQHQPYPTTRTQTVSNIGVYHMPVPPSASSGTNVSRVKALNQQVLYNSTRQMLDGSIIRAALSNPAANNDIPTDHDDDVSDDGFFFSDEILTYT